MLSIAVAAGLLIGVLLGALGGGGSILTVPVLVYLLHQEPHAATAGSLLIVGITAAAGMIAHRRAGRVRLAPGIAFGVLGVAGSYAGTRLSSSVPPGLLLSLFAGLMLAAAAAMLRRRGTAGRREPAAGSPPVSVQASGRQPAWRPGGSTVLRRVLKIIAAATGVGLLTGFFGVGGGFVIVPALVLVLGFDMPAAVGTSLLVIAINSAAALAARLRRPGPPRLGAARRVHRRRAGRGAGRQPRRVPGRRVPAHHRLHRPAHRRSRLLARPQPAWADVTGSGAGFRQAGIDHVDLGADQVHLADGTTFFGLDAISKKRHEHIKVASVGNPGLHMATLAGALPGMPGLLTAYMERKMGKLDIPPIPEFIEMIAGTGAGLYGCQASCDLFGLGKDDLIGQVTGIITVGEFYALAAGGQIIFT